MEETAEKTKYKTDKEKASSILPSWAIFSGGEKFDISTERFGDPIMGHYQQLSDVRFRVLTSWEAQEKWAVGRHLPQRSSAGYKLQWAESQQQARADAVEHEYARKAQENRW
ncbi:uncharacterized protein TM35_001101020 [Trypanosoma theileri]|uniref:Uncharacterized protein n=1 Tax=Trypanosoma theileri TaxID=67003 RepID=A0A1X0NEL0_9TRYP|nr:uncharacterized protein TM35_001101020 [Trypanosoma theileri]ORC81674.1 hypothetical protein TM35_001101020 [Trypanosoma theileri]